MCLKVKFGESICVAIRDIHVYKCLDKKGTKYLTPYKYHPVNFSKDDGIAVLSINEELEIKDCCVDRGIHGYFNAAKAIAVELLFRDDDNTMIYHAIIPKGAKYCLGDSGDIVASKMLIFKKNDDYYDYIDDKYIDDFVK